MSDLYSVAFTFYWDYADETYVANRDHYHEQRKFRADWSNNEWLADTAKFASRGQLGFNHRAVLRMPADDLTFLQHLAAAQGWDNWMFEPTYKHWNWPPAQTGHEALLKFFTVIA